MKRILRTHRILIGITVFLLLVLVLGNTAERSQAADSMWTARYWNNKTLSGDVVLQRNESNVNYDWGPNSPAPGVIGDDNFSVYWKRVVNFSAGNYRFTATMDDGMRVWVDDVLIIDSWWDSQVHSMSKDVYLYAGDHKIEIRYYEVGGQAVAKFSWAALGGTTPGQFINWKGEYFNNTSLSGSPALVRDDARIDFDWGVGSPASNVIGADRFSVRWTRTLSLQSGRYRFMVVADDGARLWINGQLMVDQWHDSYEGTYFAEVDVPGGSAAIQMEYYENVGGAVARLDWERLGGTGIYNWQGEYYNNKNLSGPAVLVRDDANVSFNWGNGSPAPGIVNNDNFSARWTKSFYFNNGRYRFTATADDGVRVWVNNQQIINGWSDHQPASFTGDIDLPTNSVPIRVEYYENTGGAMVSLSWVQISVVPAPQPTPTPVPGPTYGTGVVQTPLLNVRIGPGTQYGVIGQLVKNQSVTLAGYRSGDSHWVMINWQGSTAWVSGLPGYLWTSVPVSSLAVWTGTVPDTGGPTNGPTGTIAYCNYLNLRTGPGISYGVIRVVPAGTVVTLQGRNADSSWAKVQLTDGTIGWVRATYLVPSVPLSSLPVVG
ncbi:MAG: PA14 domain-containing protein [Candidatus Promineifilaceae bacterium]